jgi:hypothetical protein
MFGEELWLSVHSFFSKKKASFELNHRLITHKTESKLPKKEINGIPKECPKPQN